MQRRHFKAIADALNAVRPATDSQDVLHVGAHRCALHAMFRTPTLSAIRRAAASKEHNEPQSFATSANHPEHGAVSTQVTRVQVEMEEFLKEQQSSELYSQSWCETQGDNH
jgi:hypothetical protein